MKLYVATHNAHKIREISQILPDFEVEGDDPADAEETAPDFAGNALIKVRAIAPRHPGAWCMADDSGLEVAALGGAPGVRSARYAGEPTNTPANNALLLKNLEVIAPSGAEGFGYDPLFVPDGFEKSFAELSAAEKNAISHRGRALAEARRIIAGEGED